MPLSSMRLARGRARIFLEREDFGSWFWETGRTVAPGPWYIFDTADGADSASPRVGDAALVGGAVASYCCWVAGRIMRTGKRAY